MKELSEAAYLYEKWEANFTFGKKIPLSLVQPNVLLGFWQSINTNNKSLSKKQAKYDYSEGVELFTNVVFLIYENSKHQNNPPKFSDFFAEYVNSLNIIFLDRPIKFKAFIGSINKNKISDKNIAQSIVTKIVNTAKGNQKLTSVNIAHTVDLTFIHDCMSSSGIDSKLSAEKSDSIESLNTDELLFELQTRQLLHHFVQKLALTEIPIFPLELDFNHKRNFSEHQLKSIEEELDKHNFKRLEIITYHDLLNNYKDDIFDNEIEELLDNSERQNMSLSELLVSCMDMLPEDIKEYSNYTREFHKEIKVLFKIQLYIALVINPQIIVNTISIVNRSLYLSSLLNLMEYTKDKIDLDLLLHSSKEMFENLKNESIKVAKVWILYLIDRGEFVGDRYLLEDWTQEIFRSFVTKNQLIIRLTELTSSKKYYGNLQRGIHNKAVIKSLSNKGNEDFRQWLDTHNIYSSDAIDEMMNTSERIVQKGHFEPVNIMFFESLFIHNSTPLNFYWDTIFCGNDLKAFQTEIIFDSISTFSRKKSEKDSGMKRTDWRRIISQIGGRSSEVFRKFNQAFNNSIDLKTKEYVAVNRNNRLKSINFDSRINNRYKIISELGTGGNGFVVKAADNNLYREVAIKLNATSEFTHPEVFKREARILATLKHENIIQVYDFINVDDSVFKQEINAEVYGLVTEYHSCAMTLDKYLISTSLTNDQKIYLFQKICDGVSAAHAKNLIHCDLKPQNIIVTNDGTPKLIDFGSSSYEEMTSQSSGSIQWISPDVLNGLSSKKTDDIYSLTLILLHIFQLDFEHLTCALSEEEFSNPFESSLPIEVKNKTEYANSKKTKSHHIKNQNFLLEVLLFSHYLMADGWYKTNTGWEKHIGFDDSTNEVEIDYFNFYGNNNECNKFLVSLHNNVYFSHADEQRLSSFLKILLRGLLTSTSSLEVLGKTIKSNKLFNKEAKTQILQDYSKSFKHVEELKSACYALSDLGSNSVKEEFSFISQATINGQVLNKRYIENLPQISDYEDERVIDVRCQFNSFGMDYLFSDCLVLLSTGQFARLHFYTDGINIDKFDTHPTLMKLEKAPFVDILE